MNEYTHHKGTVPCHTWRMIRALEEDQYYKRPAVPGRRPPIVMPESLLAAKPAVSVETAPVETAPEKAAPAVEAAPVVEAPPAEEPAPSLFDLRLARYGSELERLYRDQFQGDLAAWDGLLTLLRRCHEERSQALLTVDERRTDDPYWYCRRDLLAMTADADAFAGGLSGVAGHLDYLKECGVNFLRLSAQGTADQLAQLADACRAQDICLAVRLTADAPQDAASFQSWVDGVLSLANAGADAVYLGDLSALSHPVLRMARLICQLVCPGVLLMGKARAYGDADFFGAQGKPECHILCRSCGSMLWNTLATGDVSLLRHEADQVLSLPREQLFFNRLHGDNGLDWALDYSWLKEHWAADGQAHRQYLSDWATGQFPGSNSRGELGAAGQVWGTTASLCGVEAADYERDHTKLEQAVACDLLLHAYLLTQSGLPALISGDEIGQLNDYSYHEDAAKAADARNLQHGPFHWELAAMRGDEGTRQGKQFQGLRRLTQLRAQEPAFDPRADAWTFDTGNPHVLGLGRWYEGRKLVALFNFSDEFVSASAPEAGAFEEMIYGGHYDDLDHVELYPYGFVWLLQH